MMCKSNSGKTCVSRRRTTVAVARSNIGDGRISIDGLPLTSVHPHVLKFKIFEPIYIYGYLNIADVNIRVLTNGGGFISRVLSARLCLARSILALVDCQQEQALYTHVKESFLAFDEALFNL